MLYSFEQFPNVAEDKVIDIPPKNCEEEHAVMANTRAGERFVYDSKKPRVLCLCVAAPWTCAGNGVGRREAVECRLLFNK